jgi:hypothetical protein
MIVVVWGVHIARSSIFVPLQRSNECPFTASFLPQGLGKLKTNKNPPCAPDYDGEVMLHFLPECKVGQWRSLMVNVHCIVQILIRCITTENTVAELAVAQAKAEEASIGLWNEGVASKAIRDIKWASSDGEQHTSLCYSCQCLHRTDLSKFGAFLVILVMGYRR